MCDLCALEKGEGKGELGMKPRASPEPQAQSRILNICFKSCSATLPPHPCLSQLNSHYSSGWRGQTERGRQATRVR